MNIPIEKDNYTYLLLCSDGSLYCGWTNDLSYRLQAHNSGTGAKYTRSRLPVKLVWYTTSATPSKAMSLEYHIKRLTRKQKEKLVSGAASLEELLPQLHQHLPQQVPVQDEN